MYLDASSSQDLIININTATRSFFHIHSVKLLVRNFMICLQLINFKNYCWVLFQKWTHVWFMWNTTDQTLRSKFDWTISGSDDNSKTFSFALNGNGFYCSSKFLQIGATLESKAIFDLDDLQIFSEALNDEELLHYMLGNLI